MTVSASADACFVAADFEGDTTGAETAAGGAETTGSFCVCLGGSGVLGPYFFNNGCEARMMRNVRAKTRSSRRSVPGSC